MKLVLKCNDLHKTFGKKEVLKGISLELYEGDILGFIGPNGAGKTTTIKLILGLQSISSGNVIINGYDTKKNFVKAIENASAIVEAPDFYMYLSGRCNLELSRNAYKNIPKERINEVVKLVGLEDRIDDKVSKYSLGMKQRLGIALALLNKPNLLILDEPTNGLDPEGIKDLRNILQTLSKDEHIAIFISSHILKELDTLCNKVCIIKNGELVETSDIDSIKHNSSYLNYILEIDDTSKISNIENNNIKIISNTNFKIKCTKEEISEVIRYLVENNIKIYSVTEEVTTLEDAFLMKTGGNKID